MRSYFDSMLRYFEFSGRSTRRQYWLFWLVSGLLGVSAVYADFALYGIRPSPTEHGPFTVFSGIVHFIPGVTVTIRRLHDIGRSGWWFFIVLIPFAGVFILLYWTILGPKEWDNAFGPDPRNHNDSRSPQAPRSSIPRQIRMGSATASRPTHLAPGEDIQRFI
jgi:uncharacterized membrane protein YhaH (DUF805 family)